MAARENGNQGFIDNSFHTHDRFPQLRKNLLSRLAKLLDRFHIVFDDGCFVMGIHYFSPGLSDISKGWARPA
jgi:hypothetical protein